jgi:hypothetical protein
LIRPGSNNVIDIPHNNQKSIAHVRAERVPQRALFETLLCLPSLPLPTPEVIVQRFILCRRTRTRRCRLMRWMNMTIRQRMMVVVATDDGPILWLPVLNQLNHDVALCFDTAVHLRRITITP